MPRSVASDLGVHYLLTYFCLAKDKYGNLVSEQGFRGECTLSWEATLSKLFLFPSEKGSTLNGNNLLHLKGAV